MNQTVALNRFNDNNKFTVLQLVLSWTKNNFNAAMAKRAAYPAYDLLVRNLLRAEADPMESRFIPKAYEFPSDFSYPQARVNAVVLRYNIDELNRNLRLAEAHPIKYLHRVPKAKAFPSDFPYPHARVDAVWSRFKEMWRDKEMWRERIGKKGRRIYDVSYTQEVSFNSLTSSSIS